MAVLSIRHHVCIFGNNHLETLVQSWVPTTRVHPFMASILLFLSEHCLWCRAEQVSSNRSDVQQLIVVCLYAAMGHDQQLQVFQPAPSGTRKVSCHLYFLIYLSYLLKS